MHWSKVGAAGLFKCSEKLWRRWETDDLKYPVRDDVLAWMEGVAAYIKNNPPPVGNRRRVVNHTALPIQV
jgi:hypothetical protein